MGNNGPPNYSGYKNSSILVSSSKSGLTMGVACACNNADDEEETSWICASNGVTYKSSCRFNCAQDRVKSEYEVQ